MQNQFKKQLAFLLAKSSKRGLDNLDPSSSCAKSLKRKRNVDSLISRDIDNICKVATFAEITKILALYALFRISKDEKRNILKEDFKIIADKIIRKSEKQYGKLNLPHPCRNLLFNL